MLGMKVLPTCLLCLGIFLFISDQARAISHHLDLVSSISPTQVVEEGSSVELECRVRDVPDGAEVTWVRIKGVGELEYLSVFDKEDGLIDYEEEQFRSVMEKDDDVLVWKLLLNQVTGSLAGLYQCQVQFEDEIVSSRKVLLSVLDPNKVEHNTKYVITKQGGNITLDCTDFNGAVNWRRLGDTSVVQDGNLLNLIRVDRSDSGIYICSVSGGSRTMNISLLVEHIPTITPTQPTIYQHPGYSSSLSCEVAAVPVPAVSWYSLGSPLGPTMVKSHGDISLEIDEFKDGRMTFSLIFHNVTQEDYGQYSCNANNTSGESSATVQLVFSPIPVLSDSGTAARHCRLLCEAGILLVTLVFLALF